MTAEINKYRFIHWCCYCSSLHKRLSLKNTSRLEICPFNRLADWTGISWVVQLYTVYVRCFWQRNHKVYMHTVLANPRHTWFTSWRGGLLMSVGACIPSMNVDQFIHPIQSNLSQSNPIQSNPIQSNPIQSNPIQSNPIQSNPIQSNPIQSSLSNPIQSNPIQSNPIHPIHLHTFHWLLTNTAVCLCLFAGGAAWHVLQRHCPVFTHYHTSTCTHTHTHAHTRTHTHILAHIHKHTCHYTGPGCQWPP